MGWEWSLRGPVARGLLEEGVRNPDLESARARGKVLARWLLREPPGAAQTWCRSMASNSGTDLPWGASLSSSSLRSASVLWWASPAPTLGFP